MLTGLPRSGTSLATYLLNKLPNTIAAAEPIGPGKFAELIPDHEAIASGIQDFYRSTRRRAMNKGVFVSKQAEGKVTDNYFAQEKGARTSLVNTGEVEINKELEPGFWLIIKDPPMFSSLLPTLLERFPCYAIIRNPLAIAASSHSITSSRGPKPPGFRASERVPQQREAAGTTVQQGNTRQQNEGSQAHKPLPTAQRYTPGLQERLLATEDPIDRQLDLFSWYFERFKLLPRENVIRYEDMIASGGSALQKIVPSAQRLSEPLSSRNSSKLYDPQQVSLIGEKLLKSSGAYWDFYSRQDVEALMEEVVE